MDGRVCFTIPEVGGVFGEVERVSTTGIGSAVNAFENNYGGKEPGYANLMVLCYDPATDNHTVDVYPNQLDDDTTSWLAQVAQPPVVLTDDDRNARRVAAEWYNGQGSALYALASTGAIGVETLPEIDRCLRSPIPVEQHHTDELRQLRAYVTRAGARGPIPGWSGRPPVNGRTEIDRDRWVIDTGRQLP